MTAQSKEVAPPPPEGFPAAYLALRCQFCLIWSTEPNPITPRDGERDSWWPLVQWHLGKRECPKGLTCLLCANVPWPLCLVAGVGTVVV